MNLIFDTNVIIHFVRAKDGNKIMDFLNPKDNDIYISYASIAEVESFALQNNWSKKKILKIANFIDGSQTVQIDDFLLKSFVDIDSFSQKRNPKFNKYTFDTPRNMGKHDLWIAATASLLNLTLVTTDRDFEHLNNKFLELRFIEPSQIRKYLL